MSKLESKIEARHRNLSEVLNQQKYTVGFFQREYSWEEKHIHQLITDLSNSFLDEYDDSHSRNKGQDYNNYYLGPFVISEQNGKRSVIDGQQRLTSLTLFLIYLNHLQKDYGLNEPIAPLIYSAQRGIKSFNIEVDTRTACLESLFEKGSYSILSSDDESVHNMLRRYDDIDDVFPSELRSEKALACFLDWLQFNVIMVEILAYSDDNAYIIFETMNDRGLSLTPTEMLKGFLLSYICDSKKRDELNTIWKKKIQQLHEYSDEEDLDFFKAWLRAQYAVTIRPGSKGSQNEDFEKIATRFHSWVRDNVDKLGIEHANSSQIECFIKRDLSFFSDVYMKILDAWWTFDVELEHVFYTARRGIAYSLSLPLMLAPLMVTDSEKTVNCKINMVAKFIEIFVVKRSINFKNVSASSIRYTMYSLVKEIRHKSIEELSAILTERINSMEESFEGMLDFYMHGNNRKFVKFLLARITAYVEKQAGMSTNFTTYHEVPKGSKPFEVEHIWSDTYERHKTEFSQISEFELFRNRLGDLLLLPNGTNQSYNDMPYKEKREHYIKENLLAQSLHPQTYKNNPNFVKAINALNLPFTEHSQFLKADIDQRQVLMKKLSEIIWAANF